ncbi:MAG: RNA 2',3'-cyclic phosphodiesterase [Henriciella sp.]|uniref:RNA 2',3'-cyclic phosphodiesterase n=1 Tax=Henriciella sp. TaxID=1968823 RepID=UPI003C728D10
MIRLFAGLPVPEDVIDRLEPLQTGLDGARWRERHHFHITLGYFGDVHEPEAEELDAAIGDIPARQFDLEIEGVGWFGRKEPGLAYATVKRSPALEALAQAVRKTATRLGIAPDAKPFRPHITLAYLNNVPLEPVRAWSERWQVFHAGPWTADRFHLYESIGLDGKKSVYDAVAEYPLG